MKAKFHPVKGCGTGAEYQTDGMSYVEGFKT